MGAPYYLRNRDYVRYNYLLFHYSIEMNDFSIFIPAPLEVLALIFGIVPKMQQVARPSRIDEAVDNLRRCSEINGKVIDLAVLDQIKF